MPFPVFATMEEVPELFRPEYENRDNAWHPKLPDVSKLEGTLVKVREERDEAIRKQRDAEAREAAARAELDARKSGATEAQIEEIRQKSIAPLQEKLTAYETKLKKALLTDRVQALALENGVMADRLKVAMRLLEERAEIGDEEGIVWKDENGKTTAMDASEFFAEFKKEHSYLFLFTGGSGSGSQGSSRTTTTTPAAPSIDARKRASVMGAF